MKILILTIRPGPVSVPPNVRIKMMIKNSRKTVNETPSMILPSDLLALHALRAVEGGVAARMHASCAGTSLTCNTTRLPPACAEHGRKRPGTNQRTHWQRPENLKCLGAHSAHSGATYIAPHCAASGSPEPSADVLNAPGTTLDSARHCDASFTSCARGLRGLLLFYVHGPCAHSATDQRARTA